MTTLNVSLPDSMREYIDQKVAEGSYGTASEYISRLIREDQERSARERIDALLIEGLESGEPIEITDGWWQKKEAELAESLNREPRP